jgi:hypothetical protein
VGDVASTEKDRFLNRQTDRYHSRARLRQLEGPRPAVSARIRWSEQRVGPGGIEMAVVPGDVLLDHRPCRGMGRHVIDAALAHHEDLPAVAQCDAVSGTGSHARAFGVMAVSSSAGLGREISSWCKERI